METNKRVQFPANCIRLCFDRYDDKVCEGRICGVTLENEIPFHTITELIVKIDDAFNEIGQPQPHQVLRSFHKTAGYQSYKSSPKHYYSSGEIAERKGQLKTVDLLMRSRQRAEWQGMLKDTDNAVIGEFSSSLECMELFEKILN